MHLWPAFWGFTHLTVPAGPSAAMLHMTNRRSVEPVPAGSSSESRRWLASSPFTKRIERRQEEKEYSRRTYIEN